MISFLESSQDSFRSQQFVLERLARLKEKSNPEPKSSLLDCLPRIQEILAGMRHLEEFRARGEQDQCRHFKLELITKVQMYLDELAKQRALELEKTESPSMDTSLVNEYKQQLEGILEVLSQPEPETHSTVANSQSHRAKQSLVKKSQRVMSRSRSFSQKTYSSNNLSPIGNAERKHLFRPDQKGGLGNSQFKRTGGFVCGETEEGVHSERTNRTTLDQKLGVRDQNQRFTFKHISSEKRGGNGGLNELEETLGRARTDWKGEDYCQKFNEAQVKLFREKIKRKRDLLRSMDSKQQWKAQLLRGRSNRDNLEMQNKQYHKVKGLLKQSNAEQERLRVQLKKTEDRLEKSTQQVELLRSQIGEMGKEDQARRARFAREKDELERKLRDIEANVNKMRGQMEERRDKEGKRSKERAEWREERDRLREHIAGVEKDNVFLAEKLSQLKQRVKEKKEERNEKEQKEEQARKRIQDRTEEVVTRQRKEMAMLKAELEKTRREMGRLEEEVVFTKGSQMVERKTLEGLRDKIDSFENKREKWRKRKTEHSLLEREKKRLERTCLELEEAAKRDQDQLRRANAQIDGLESCLKIANKKVERLENQIRANEKEILYLELGTGKRKGDIEVSRGEWLTRRTIDGKGNETRDGSQRAGAAD